jgi:hypothetical protein
MTRWIEVTQPVAALVDRRYFPRPGGWKSALSRPRRRILINRITCCSRPTSGDASARYRSNHLKKQR